MFSEENVDTIIEYVLDLSGPEMKMFKLLIKNNVTPYKALDQVIDKREQKIEIYLRKAINPWKNKILADSLNVCFITDISRPDRMDVHHTNISFDSLVSQTFQETKLIHKEKVKDYTPRELTLLRETILKLHENVQGVVLLQEVHQLFHKEYGMNNNSINQIYELRNKFKTGQFKINF